MKLLFLDTETYSTVRIELGLDRYFMGAKCLIVTYAFDDQPVQHWDVEADASVPDDLHQALGDPEVTLVCHNLNFDWHALQLFGYEVPIARCFCTMACAYSHALPGSLEALGPVVGVPNDYQKMAAGKELIRLFCIAQKDGKPKGTPESHPMQWAQFLEYARVDTAALREVYKRLPKHNYTGEGHELWQLDFEVNNRGFFVDQELCAKALILRDGMREHLEREITDLTDGVITKGTQRERVLNRVFGEYGFMMFDMQKDTIKKVLDEEPLGAKTARLARRANGESYYNFTTDEQAYFLLELRRDSSLTSLTKYERALERVGDDGRMRHTIQFAGAGRTGRFAGRGFQPHNMPRPKTKPEYVEEVIIPAILDGTLSQKVDDVNQCCSDALRGTIIAEPGNELLVGDWSNIEGVCNAWEAGDEKKLQRFRDNYFGDGPDCYVLLYADSFGVELESIDSKKRQMGKGMELSMGYGGGVGAFKNVASAYGLDIPELGRVVPNLVTPEVYNKAEKAWERAFLRGEDQMLEPAEYIACDALKQVWRKANPEIVQMWWDVERAVKWAIDRPGSVHNVARCKIWRTPAWLIVELPSGRRLLYAQPEVRKTVDYNEETGRVKESSYISYMASTAKQWRRERTYGGKIVENITQAIANDVLRAAMLRAKAVGYPIILHVHDEIVAEVMKALFGLQDFLDLMQEPLWWAPDLPLKAAGYISERYKKD